MMINDRPSIVSYSLELGFYLRGPDCKQYPIQHCFRCGALLPKQIPDGLIALEREYDRIFDKASTVETPDDCYESFGVPSYDAPFPDEHGKPTDLRNIEYYEISNWYQLAFYFTSPGYFRFAIIAKLVDAESTR